MIGRLTLGMHGIPWLILLFLSLSLSMGVNFEIHVAWYIFQLRRSDSHIRFGKLSSIWVKNVNSAKWMVYISILLNISKYGLCRIRGGVGCIFVYFEMMFVFSFFEL